MTIRVFQVFHEPAGSVPKVLDNLSTAVADDPVLSKYLEYGRSMSATLTLAQCAHAVAVASTIIRDFNENPALIENAATTLRIEEGLESVGRLLVPPVSSLSESAYYQGPEEAQDPRRLSQETGSVVGGLVGFLRRPGRGRRAIAAVALFFAGAVWNAVGSCRQEVEVVQKWSAALAKMDRSVGEPSIYEPIPLGDFNTTLETQMDKQIPVFSLPHGADYGDVRNDWHTKRHQWYTNRVRAEPTPTLGRIYERLLQPDGSLKLYKGVSQFGGILNSQQLDIFYNPGGAVFGSGLYATPFIDVALSYAKHENSAVLEYTVSPEDLYRFTGVNADGWTGWETMEDGKRQIITHVHYDLDMFTSVGQECPVGSLPVSDFTFQREGDAITVHNPEMAAAMQITRVFVQDVRKFVWQDGDVHYKVKIPAHEILGRQRREPGFPNPTPPVSRLSEDS